MAEDDLAALFYTSGTTGAAKGAMHTHRSLVCSALHFMATWPFDRQTRWLVASPMFHTGGIIGTLATVWAGGAHVIMPRFDPDLAVDLIEREAVTHTLLVPTMLAAAAGAQLARPRNVSSLRYLSHGASPISAETLRRTRQAFPDAELLHVYGTTEVTPITTLLPHEERILDTPLVRSCGQPAMGVEIRVVDSSQADVPPGAVGEIIVRGPSVMAGYWRKPEATAEVMRGDWYLTGDLGYTDEASYIYLVDRVKDMIVSGGENIYSIEVEDALATHPAVAESAVFGVPDPRWGESVYAVVFLPEAGDGGRAGRALPRPDRRIQGTQVHRVAHRAAAQVGGGQDPQARPARTALGRSAHASLRRLAMRSTMMDFPLTVRHIFWHGRTTYADSEVVTNEAEGVRRIEFGALADRADQLAAGLRRLGVEPGDRVATFAWNTQEHQEAYFAIPGMGAVMHTLNIRLSAEQIRYIIGHAEDSVILADASLAPVLAPVLAAGGDELKTLRHLIVFGEGDRSGLPKHIDYEELLAAERPGFDWPEIEETAAAAMCYTSGTTDRPKGVVYSHRSTFLHSLGLCSGEALGLSQYDRLLPVVPMFHGNAWGMPYAAWLVGADLLLPNRFTQAEPLARFIAEERATLATAVPTVWYDVLGLDPATVDLKSLRMILAGGAAVPRSLIEAYEQRFGVRVVQGWGLTETSPVAAVAHPPKNAPAEQAMGYRATAGRALGGVEARIVDDEGKVLPRDGHSTGEIEVRGPWVTGAYYRDPASAKFRDGWLRTGDVGRVDGHGYITISDRAKDVVKSGGEWISTLELEAAILTHPAVREAAVIAAPDERWGERPLACIARVPGESVSPEELRAHLSGLVVKWWLPDQWAFVDVVPRTSVGKHDKKLLRARNAEGSLNVVVSDEPPKAHPAT